MIFDINRYAINDGPGIRLTIFLKGCPLSCRWCHNPESHKSERQKMYKVSSCILCGECVIACPLEACKIINNRVVTDVQRCNLCGNCAEVCPTKAIEMSGREESIDQLLALVERERIFLEQSGGGVTLSGGEPLSHPGFIIPLLDALGDIHIHRAVDTSGYAPESIALKVSMRTDLFLYDLKIMDPAKHMAFTGVDNRLILDNLKMLADMGARVNIRFPLIKGVNDDQENIIKMAKFLASLPGHIMPVSVLPYHDIARNKYEKLGLDYQGESYQEPSAKEQEAVLATFAAHGIAASIGG